MPKIIKHGTKPDPARLFTCGYCGRVFEAGPDEYQVDFDRNETYVYCKCPECGCTVYSPYRY